MISNNSTVKTILCFGDSNTHGTKPDKTGRFGPGIRWTRILQEKLGDSHYVIEEGLGGRTTNLDHPKPEKPNRNGWEYFKPAVESHSPLDVIVIMLGTNDWKIDYNRSAEETVNVLQDYVEYARSKNENAHIILMCPIAIDTNAELFADYYTGTYDEISADKAKDSSELIKALAEELNVGFLDASSVAKPGVDGIHIDRPSHDSLASLVANAIVNESE